MKRKYFWTYILIGSVALLSLIVVEDSRLRGQSVDMELLALEPGQSFYFRLEIAGRDVGVYEECRGLGSSNDVEEVSIQAPSGMIVRQKTPGELQWHSITLRRTEPSGADVWSWRKAMEDGNLAGAIKDGAVTLWGRDPAKVLARWEYQNGWIASLEFNESGEEMIIVHDGLERSDPVPTGGGMILR